MANQMEKFDEYEAADDYQTYRHINPSKNISLDQGIELFRPYLKSFCDFNSGKLNINVKLDIDGFLLGSTSGGLDNCISDDWVIAGLGYGKYDKNRNQKTLESISIYYPDNWEEAEEKLKIHKKELKKIETSAARLLVNMDPIKRIGEPASNNSRAITCTTRCMNGDCKRTYSDGRKIHFQAKMKWNPFNNQMEFDSGGC
jgi:hypothetical protein